jgi:hypothetical protein
MRLIGKALTFDDVRDLVLVARIRHQRESGYTEMEL